MLVTPNHSSLLSFQRFQQASILIFIFGFWEVSCIQAVYETIWHISQRLVYEGNGFEFRSAVLPCPVDGWLRLLQSILDKYQLKITPLHSITWPPLFAYQFPSLSPVA